MTQTDDQFADIWIGPEYPRQRILVLGESWYGNWADNTDRGYITLYLAGDVADAMYTKMANACGRSKADFWNSIAFTNFAERVGDRREDRPTKEHYEVAAARLTALLEHLRPRGVWVLGKGQAEHSVPVIEQAGVPYDVSVHPTGYGVKNATLGESWARLMRTQGEQYEPHR